MPFKIVIEFPAASRANSNFKGPGWASLIHLKCNGIVEGWARRGAANCDIGLKLTVGEGELFQALTSPGAHNFHEHACCRFSGSNAPWVDLETVVGQTTRNVT